MKFINHEYEYFLRDYLKNKKLKIFRALKTNYITQGFGLENTAQEMLPLYQSLGMEGHNGIDFGCWCGEPIHHCGEFSGIVKTEVDSKGGIGVDVISENKIDGSYYKLRYWHLKKVGVYDGQKIKEGDLIGWGDTTGLSTGNHLHLGLKPCDKDGNPTEKRSNGYYGAVDPTEFFENVFVLDILETKQLALSSIQLAKKVINDTKLWLVQLKGDIKTNKPMETKNKKWWKSKTIIIAVLQAVVGIIAAFIIQFPGLAYLITSKSIIDVIIRVVTNTKIE